MTTEQTTIANVMPSNPERVQRVLEWIEQQASKTDLYDAKDDLGDYYCGNEDDAREIGEKNGQIATAKSLHGYLAGVLDWLPEIEEFTKDEDEDEE